MTPQEIRLVRSSFDRLEPRAVQAAELFLGHLLRADPAIAPMLNGEPAEQGQRLMQLIGVVVSLLDKPGQLNPVLRKMGARCAAYRVNLLHCDTLATAMLRALSEALGDAFDAETCDAWIEMYAVVSRTLLAAARAAEAEARVEPRVEPRVEARCAGQAQGAAAG